MEEIHSSSSNFENNYDDYYSQKSQEKVSHQFYLVKFCPSFVDPALKEKIEKSNELIIKRMDRAREIISREIRSVEVKMHEKRDEIDELRRYGNFNVQYLMTWVEGLLRQFEIQWPGEINDIDLDQDLEVVDGIVEDINVDDKIEELSNTLNHGRRNLAEERRILRELKVMQRRKKHHDHPVKPTTFQRPRWNSKECIQQRILTALKQARDKKERERKLIEEYEAIKDETQKQIMPLKEKEADIDRKKARANRRILKVKTRLNEHVAIYDEYLTLKIKANELAEKKDLVALEELSYKQVEEFMSRWKNDESFRVNYKRSIIPILRHRKPSCDGRRLEEEVWRKIP